MSLNINNIKIENVRVGSVKQKEKGILGKYSLDFYLEDGTLFISLKDMALCKTRDGQKYIRHPFATWGDPEKKNKMYYHYLYAGSTERDTKLAPLLKKISTALDEAEADNGNVTPQPTTTSAGSSIESDLFN